MAENFDNDPLHDPEADDQEISAEPLRKASTIKFLKSLRVMEDSCKQKSIESTMIR